MSTRADTSVAGDSQTDMSDLRLPAESAAIIERVDQFMDERLAAESLPESLDDAIRYALLAPGKRLRPLLVALSCQTCAGAIEDALPACMALECIHAFSLVHDDLPSMDDDDLRRGRPTLHIARGEAMAILAGDALMSLAFRALSTASAPADRQAALVGELSRGAMAMIEGQVYDTFGGLDRELSDQERLELIHRNKTGALIRAACRMGAICADAGDDRIGAMSRYGEAIGLMFQVVDDLLDVEQSTERAGKRTGKDQLAGKLTYPSVLGVEKARAVIDEQLEVAKASIAEFGPAGGSLADLADFLTVRTA